MDTNDRLSPEEEVLLHGDTDGDIGNFAELALDQASNQGLEWLVSEDTTFEGLQRFEYNEQMAIVECLCGDPRVIEIFSGSSAICRGCGRLYSIDSRIVVNWAK